MRFITKRDARVVESRDLRWYEPPPLWAPLPELAGFQDDGTAIFRERFYVLVGDEYHEVDSLPDAWKAGYEAGIKATRAPIR